MESPAVKRSRRAVKDRSDGYFPQRAGVTNQRPRTTRTQEHHALAGKSDSPAAKSLDATQAVENVPLPLAIGAPRQHVDRAHDAPLLADGIGKRACPHLERYGEHEAIQILQAKQLRQHRVEIIGQYV